MRDGILAHQIFGPITVMARLFYDGREQGPASYHDNDKAAIAWGGDKVKEYKKEYPGLYPLDAWEVKTR
jgi:hypothetical protein